VGSTSRFGRKREGALFLLIGGCVAVIGQVLLVHLIGAGIAPAVANATQIVVTPQLSFIAHDLLTWRLRTGDSAAWRTGRWWRFQTARGSSAVLSLVAFRRCIR
jgi:glycosyltransferase XagB